MFRLVVWRKFVLLSRSSMNIIRVTILIEGEKDMDINYELTEEDYVLFNLYHNEQSPSQKRLYWTMRYILPALFVVPIYFIGTRVFNQAGIYWAIIALVFVVGWALYYPKEHKKLIRKQVLKMLREGDNSSFFSEKSLSVQGETITIVDADSTHTLTKESIKSVKVYDEMIILYVSAVSAHIIPTRYIDGETRGKLLELLG